MSSSILNALLVIFLLLCSIFFFLVTIRNAIRYYYGLTDAMLRTAFFLGNSTEWVQGFEEKKFSAVTLGMTKSEVMQIVGTRFFDMDEWWCSGETKCYWIYTRQIETWMNYDRRWIIFDNGRVTSIVHSYWID